MITPREVPVAHPENTALVDVLRGVRYDLGNLADRVGDLERTIRLHAEPVGNGHKEVIAGLLAVGATNLAVGAERVLDTKQGESR